MVKIEESKVCPNLTFDYDDLVHVCRLGDQVINKIGDDVFEIRDMRWHVVSCPKDFKADETGVPCFCAAIQIREQQEAQRPLNRLMAKICEIGAEFKRQNLI